MAELHLPTALAPLFPGLPRRLELDAATVGQALDRLDERWPGFRDRLCDPGPTLRRHIHVYVDGERAGLDAPLGPGSQVDVVTAITGGRARADPYATRGSIAAARKSSAR